MKSNQASSTALLIARSIAFSSGEPSLAHLIFPESAELAWAVVDSQSKPAARLHRWLCKPRLRWIIRSVEAAALPGIQLHYALRKRLLEDAADSAINSGIRQVVIIAAGFDALGLRLSRRRESIACIELDHPATQAVKRVALARMGPPVGDLHLIAVDLTRERLKDALAQARFDPQVPTFFVAEGVTMYLQEYEVKGLLSICADFAPAGSRFAWTFMEPDQDGRFAFRSSRRGLVDAWLRDRGEPFTWGLSRDAVGEFVRPLGLEIVEIVDDVELRGRYLAGRTTDALAAGELICVLTKP